MNRDEHRRHTREAYDRLAPVWSATTDDGPWNGHLERPALRALVPRPLEGTRVLDAGCGSGANVEWLLDEGAQVIGIDSSPGMITRAQARCGDRARLELADLAEPLPCAPDSLDGITCSLTLHYLEDWSVPLQSFAASIRSGGWLVMSTDHPAAPPLPSQRGSYFDTELVSADWQKGPVEVTQHFWRRPLGAVLDACADASFALDRVHEVRPSSEALARYPDELGPFADVPTFIVYRFLLHD